MCSGAEIPVSVATYGPTNSLNGAGKTNGNVWENNVYEDGAVISRAEE